MGIFICFFIFSTDASQYPRAIVCVCECVCVCAHACAFMHVLSHSAVADSLRPHALEPTRPLCPWDSPGKNTGVGCHFLLQGIFPTQGSNPCLLCLLHCREILYPLSHLGSPPRAMLNKYLLNEIVSPGSLAQHHMRCFPISVLMALNGSVRLNASL